MACHSVLTQFKYKQESSTQTPQQKLLQKICQGELPIAYYQQIYQGLHTSACRELTHLYRWILQHLFTRQLEGITSPCSLLTGQYPHHMTLLPSSFYGERCYGIHLYIHTGIKTCTECLFRWHTLTAYEAIYELIKVMSSTNKPTCQNQLADKPADLTWY